MVGWLEFNVLFQHKYDHITHERSGVRVVLRAKDEEGEKGGALAPCRANI